MAVKTKPKGGITKGAATQYYNPTYQTKITGMEQFGSSSNPDQIGKLTDEICRNNNLAKQESADQVRMAREFVRDFKEVVKNTALIESLRLEALEAGITGKKEILGYVLKQLKLDKRFSTWFKEWENKRDRYYENEDKLSVQRIETDTEKAGYTLAERMRGIKGKGEIAKAQHDAKMQTIEATIVSGSEPKQLSAAAQNERYRRMYRAGKDMTGIPGFDPNATVTRGVQTPTPVMNLFGLKRK